MSSESSPLPPTEHNHSKLINEKLPIRMISTVVRGFGRGSSDLGIPTANLAREGGTFGNGGFDDLPTGIYWGFCRIGADDTVVYKTACSIGYNPTYGNKVKTVEPHLIAPPNDERRHKSSCGESVLGDFYDQPIRLSVVGYLRPELPFEGLEKLVAAIKKDISDAEKLGEDEDKNDNSKDSDGVGSASAAAEKDWVASNAPIE